MLLVIFLSLKKNFTSSAGWEGGGGSLFFYTYFESVLHFQPCLPSELLRSLDSELSKVLGGSVLTGVPLVSPHLPVLLSHFRILTSDFRLHIL